MSKARLVRVGLAGCGRHTTRSLMPNLLAHPDTLLVAACDPLPERRGYVEAHWPYLKLFASASEMLDHHEELALDAVVLSMNPEAHTKYCRAAVELGLHVFVEKPPALRSSDLAEAADEIDRRGLTSTVGTKWRYTQATQLASRRSRGRVVAMNLDATFPALLDDHLWGLDTVQVAFYDMFIHAFDYLDHWMGRPSDVSASLTTVGGCPAAQVLLTYPGTKSAVASLASGSAAYEVECIAHLKDGTKIRVTDLTRLEITEPRTWTGTPGSLRDHASLRWGPGRLYRGYGRAGYAEQWDAFIKAIERGQPTATNLRTAMGVLETVERCLMLVGHSLESI